MVVALAVAVAVAVAVGSTGFSIRMYLSRPFVELRSLFLRREALMTSLLSRLLGDLYPMYVFVSMHNINILNE